MRVEPWLAAELADLAMDNISGASDLVRRAADLALAARRRGHPMEPVAAGLVAAQPSMAPFWVLAVEALASDRTPERLDRFNDRLARSGKALARVALEHLAPQTDAPLRLVTLSASSAVCSAVTAIAGQHRVLVACTESRPALEGRRLAAQLAAAGVTVTLYADAAIAHGLPDADAVLVGADAVAPDWILNKSGTRMLAAAALQQGVPLYVLCTRDKLVPAAIASRLPIHDGPPQQVWDAPPPGVEVRNPYFERTPVELVAAVISDAGVLGTGMLPDACAAAVDPAALQALLTLLDHQR